ncbi:MAG TPA: hypothetical protein ENJ41_08655 [Oceanospirillales bacterium]|nr:hypothetical protein [Oceanospirillales bacterium]
MYTRRAALHNSITTDNNGLETDIMRFFAIISLCLMVVFALVQSIPMKGKGQRENAPSLISTELLKQEMANLQRQITQLTLKNRQLEQQLGEKQQQWIKDKTRLAKLQQQIKKSLSHSQQALKKSQQKLQQASHQAEQIQQKNEFQAKKLLLSRVQYKKAWHDYKKARQKTVLAGDLMKQAKQTRISKREKEQPPVKNKQAGFTLKFTDDESLLHLIKNNSVQYYLVSGSQVFLYQWQVGHWQLKAVSIKENMYMMQKKTVPDVLFKSARKKVVAFANSQLQFGIVLPPVIITRIHHYQKHYRGGDIIITRAGQVEIKNAN